MPRLTAVVLAHQAFPSVAHTLLPAAVDEYRLLWLWGQRAQSAVRDLCPLPPASGDLGTEGSRGQEGDIFHQGGPLCVKLRHHMASGFNSFIHSLSFIYSFVYYKIATKYPLSRINGISE